MKYIRTEDGRIIDLTSKQISSYEVVDDKKAIDEYGADRGFIMVYYYDEDIGEHIEYDNKGGHSMDNWDLKDIIKQSDTIEELCDYAVYRDCYKDLVFRKLPLSTSFESLFRNMQHNMVSDVKVAILTDKGLIYVAKMNEKGELELL